MVLRCARLARKSSAIKETFRFENEDDYQYEI